ncbi:MAG: aminoacyl-tRNA hydrolase [Duodenibacillus sp.]
MANEKPIALIVGLGNPGDEYRDTRHNVGWHFLDALACEKHLRFTDQAKFFGQTARLSTPSGDVWLLKPTTYMNRSGSAVQAMAAYYKIAPEEILVVHDELDLVPGTMKMKKGGGNAGHNGLKDIAARLSTPEFWRLRIGIGHPRQFCPQQRVYDWVLGRPSPEHEEGIAKCLEAALRTVDNFAAGNFDRVKRTVGKFATLPKTEPATEVKAVEKPSLVL